MPEPKNGREEPDDVPDAPAGEGDAALVPCPLAEVERHLRAFIAAFVLPEARDRWLEFLITRRAEWDVPLPKTNPGRRAIREVRKADEVMGRFAVDRRYCAKLPNAGRTRASYDRLVGPAPGVYFGVGEQPGKMRAADADARFARQNGNALLSFEAGRKAVFFRHDDGVWLCEKP